MAKSSSYPDIDTEKMKSLKSDAEIWDWDKNDEILGALVEKKENVGKNNSNQYFIQEKNTQKIYAVWGSMVLDEMLADLQFGEEIYIKYTGKAKSSGGFSYKTYEAFRPYRAGEDKTSDVR